MRPFHKREVFLLRLCLIIILFLNFTLVNGQQHDCSSLPSLNSEHDAIEILRDTRFNLVDTADVSQSSWIVSAKYLGCEGHNGYIILSARYSDYLHQAVPLPLWDQFKMARDKDTFYMKALKNKYDFKKN